MDGHVSKYFFLSLLSPENQTSWICPKFQIQPKLSFLAGADKKVYQEAVASTGQSALAVPRTPPWIEDVER